MPNILPPSIARSVVLLAAGACGAIVPGSGPRGATIVPPRNYLELAASSDAVVLIRAGISSPSHEGGLTTTRTEATVERPFKGDLRAGDQITVQTLGGDAGGVVWAVPGSPRFEPGAAYLLCLSAHEDGRFRSRLLSYGLLRETPGADGTPLLVPVEESRQLEPFPRHDGELVEPILPARRDDFLAHLERALRGVEPWDGASVSRGVELLLPDGAGGAPPAGCTYFEDQGRKFRWQTFDTGGTATILADAKGDPSLAGGGFLQVQEAMNLWMGIAGTSFNLLYGGPTDVVIDCATGGAARDGVIVFNDPCSEMASGILAVGGPIATSTHTFDGATWLTITGWIVIVNDGAGGVGAGNYVFLLAHELGHGLGFGHVEDGNALMYGACCHDVNATDIRCARYTYPAVDPANQRPAVDAGPDHTLTLAGDTALLAGSVTDDGLPATGALSARWQQLGGPGTVTFGDATALQTTATFSVSGDYLLGLAAEDGQLLAVDVVAVAARIFVGSLATTIFQQGVSGYAGALDTTIAQSAPAANRGAEQQLRVDGDDPGGSAQVTQALLRFDGIFGPDPDQVPPGALIRGATLELNTENAGSGATLHRMVEDWSERSSWTSFGGDGLQLGREALRDVDATVTSPAVGLSRVDVTRSLAAWSVDPCESLGWALLPLGDDGWVFTSTEGATRPRLVVERSAVRRRELIRLGDRWRYFKGTQSPPAAWAEPEFVPPGTWLQGATGIGYGDGDDATVLSDMQNRYITVYCRRDFTLADPEVVGRLFLAIDYDDGFIAYLNGVEAARSATMGAPGDAVTRTTLAASRDAGRAETYRLDPALLVAGTNVLALEVHNSSLDSSDLSLLPRLEAEDLTLADGAEWRYWKGTAAPPASWRAVDFDDASWDAGRAGIGYGDGDDYTELADMEDRFLTLFVRRAFLPPPGGFTAPPRLTVISDDGVVVSLNGVEIGRDNVAAGAVTHQTAAIASREAEEASFALPLNLLRSDVNVLAISVHNSALDSSDLSFDAVLIPALAGGAEIACGDTFRRGDGAGDGTIDIADAVRLLFHLFLGTENVACPDGADFNDDGALSLPDAIGILSFLFRRGPAPAAPGVQCGLDNTADALEACVATCGS